MYARSAWSNAVDLLTCRVIVFPMGTEYICGPVGIGVPVQGLLLPVSYTFVFVIMSWYLLMLSSVGTVAQKTVPVRATLECHGGYTVTWADRGENQRVNNHPKYNKGDLT